MSNQERSVKNAVAHFSRVSGTTARSDTEAGSGQDAAPTPLRGSVYRPTLSELYPEADWDHYVLSFDAQGRIILPHPYDQNPPGRRTGPGEPLGPATVKWRDSTPAPFRGSVYRPSLSERYPEADWDHYVWTTDAQGKVIPPAPYRQNAAGSTPTAAGAAWQAARNQVPPQVPGSLDFGAGGTKTGCGGKCQQAYDDHGQYSGGAGGGDGTGATSGGGSSPPVPNVPPLRKPAGSRPPVPAGKREIPQVTDNWEAWNDVLDRMGLTEREKEVYRQVFAAEGGVKVSQNNRTGGIKNAQLANNSLEGLAESYRAKFDEAFKQGGSGLGAGGTALNAIQDPSAATAVGDTLFHYGREGGGTIVRDALKEVDGKDVANHTVTGDSINRINAATSRPGGREEFLAAMREATLKNEPRARSGGDSNRLTHITR